MCTYIRFVLNLLILYCMRLIYHNYACVHTECCIRGPVPACLCNITLLCFCAVLQFYSLALHAHMSLCVSVCVDKCHYYTVLTVLTADSLIIKALIAVKRFNSPLNTNAYYTVNVHGCINIAPYACSS